MKRNKDSKGENEREENNWREKDKKGDKKKGNYAFLSSTYDKLFD